VVENGKTIEQWNSRQPRVQCQTNTNAGWKHNH